MYLLLVYIMHALFADNDEYLTHKHCNPLEIVGKMTSVLYCALDVVSAS